MKLYDYSQTAFSQKDPLSKKGFDSDLHLEIVNVRPEAGRVSVICYTTVCPMNEPTMDTKSVKMILEAVNTFKGERLVK